MASRAPSGLIESLAGGRASQRPVRPPSYAGVIGAIALFCLSLTPSLLPRTTLLQGLLSGVCLAIGYALGTATGALVRRYWTAAPRVRGRAWTVLAGTGLALATGFLLLGAGWQAELRRLTGMERDWHPLLVPLLAIGVGGVLVFAGRGLRAVVRSAPRPTAGVAGVAALAMLMPGLGQGVATPVMLVADQYMSTLDASAVKQPASPYVSGGPGSLVPWHSLGGKGQEFVAGATGRSIRVYVGLETAPTPGERARLAIRELARTGGFDRSVIAMVVVTGSGGVNPAMVEGLERRYPDDAAVVTIQYSELPSWVSFLTDRSLVVGSARALIDAVHAAVAALPAADRPTLLVYGESLGAYGIERAYPDPDQLLARVDGALLAGPPHGPMWQARDRLVYLENPTDPVSRWNPDLVFQRPGWVDRAPGEMRWLPVVTFWQVTVDMLAAVGVPAGHGHSYGGPLADAWTRLASHR